MKGFKKIAALGMCAGLAFTSLAGCSKKETLDTEATALTVNGDTVSLGVVNFALRYNQANYESLYAMLGMTDPFNQDMYGAGTTLGDDMKSVLTEELTHGLLAEQKAEEYGVALTDEQKSAITSAAAAFMEANEEEVLTTLGVTQEHIERYLELTTVRTLMEEQMSADVDTEVSDEEAAQRKIQYVLFTPVTDEQLAAEAEAETETETTAVETETQTESTAETDTETDAQTEAVAETETEVAETDTETSETAELTENEEVKTGSSDETETEANTQAASEAATEADTQAVMETEIETEAETEADTQAVSEVETEAETEDPEAAEAMERARVRAEEMLAKVQDGEDFEKAAEAMDKTASTTTFGADYSLAELVEATEGLADGTVVETPIETANGYYVVKVLSAFDQEATDEKKETIVTQRKQEQIGALYTEWTEAGEVSVDEKVMEKLTFDYSLVQPEETETEGVSEAATEVTTENASEAATEVMTESANEAATEAATENVSEAVTEAETQTEAASEAVTE